MRLILASASPQRLALLSEEGFEFEVRPSGVEEVSAGESAAAVVLENARRKARAVHREAPEATVIGVDTIVELDGEIFGQPSDRKVAADTLERLSGRAHNVHSGVCVIGPSGERTGVEVTQVEFRTLSEIEINDYLELGEWQGRAGGYAIQGAGDGLVAGIRGDRNNVIGLPLVLLRALLD